MKPSPSPPLAVRPVTHTCTITDKTGTTTYQYDALGRVTAKTQNIATVTAKSFTITYSYANGRLTTIRSGLKNLINSPSAN